MHDAIICFFFFLFLFSLVYIPGKTGIYLDKNPSSIRNLAFAPASLPKKKKSRH